MPYENLSHKAANYLDKLCLQITNRRLGSLGNQQATKLFSKLMASFGFEITYHEFECKDWEAQGALLQAGGIHFQAFPSPYSQGCSFQAPLVQAATTEELQATNLTNKIVLLHGELVKEQLMPKKFPFYNPEHHQHILQLLESKAPLAIIAATDKDPALAGGISPFPLIEDGDFEIPSVYMTDKEGIKLLPYTGDMIKLESRAQRIHSRGCNVIASKWGKGEQRVVLTAHIDAKLDSPGALDNATGVVILLLLAELFQDYAGDTGIELVALNGEDHYSALGEIKYLEHNQGRLEDILLNINLDGVGFQQGGTAYSFYECGDEITSLVGKTFSSHSEMLPGDIWYSGDHMIFVQNGVAALALTSEHGMTGLAEVSHTPRDRPELVDPSILASVALALQDLLLNFPHR